MTIYINGTTGVSGVDGSASTPAVQGTDTNTGIVFPAADTVAVSTGGSERMRVDSSGNVGIGTSSPQTKLDVNGIVFSRDASFPAYKFANASGTALAEIYYGVGASDLNIVSNQASGRVVFQTNGSERARIDSSGNLLIGQTASSGSGKQEISFPVSSAVGFRFNMTDTTYNNAVMEFRTSTPTRVGYIYCNASSTAYNTSSDYRLKEDIAPMIGALAKVVALKPVTYKWKTDGSDGEGFIAHELAEVVPQCVTGEKDAVDADGNPVYQGIDTSFLVATLTAAIQELKAELDAVKAQLEAK